MINQNIAHKRTIISGIKEFIGVMLNPNIDTGIYLATMYNIIEFISIAERILFINIVFS